MARGGYRPGAGRHPKGEPAVAVEAEAAAVAEGISPLDYMLRVMRDPRADKIRRDRMAIAAAPYVHARSDEGGKKQERERAAKHASGGKFAPKSPPPQATDNVH